MMTHSAYFFSRAAEICNSIDYDKIEEITQVLKHTRDSRGRVFVLGVGGSAGNASHMVNDLRKLCSIEAYAPTDNVSELTARTNDEGFDTIFSEWLRVSNFNRNDTIFVLSVGGGSRERQISMGLVSAIEMAKEREAHIVGIVGKSDGYAATEGNCIVIPSPDPDLITPLSEAFQAVVWHCMVSNPELQTKRTTW